MTPEEKSQVLAEESECKKRIIVLRAMEGAPPVQGPPRVVIDVTEEQMVEFHRLARRTPTSYSALGQRAVKQLLGQARSGSLSLTVTPDMFPPKGPVPAEPKMTAEEIDAEIKRHNWRLNDMSNLYRMDRPSGKGPPRVVVGLTVSEFAELKALSEHLCIPVSALGQQAIGQMLDQVEAGALPMVVPSTFANAIDRYD